MNKGQISFEFIMCILILLIIIGMFININLSLKEKYEEKTKNNYNLKICMLKESYLEEKRGVIEDEICKSTDYDNGYINLDNNSAFNN